MKFIGAPPSDIREWLHYDERTGLFTWIKAPERKSFLIGKIAGYECEGYIAIKFRQKKYLAHRLAWFFIHGVMPEEEIDHRNGKTSDNRKNNLRDASRQINAQNLRAPHKDKKTIPFLGVRRTLSGKFAAEIRAFGKTYYLGNTFTTVEQASKAYIKAKRKLHEGCTI